MLRKMLRDAKEDSFSAVYIRPGHTDCRMGVNGLSNLIQFEFNLDPFEKNVLFLFCGRSRKMIKGILWDGDGFIIMSKYINGRYQWPSTKDEVRQLTYDEFKRLMTGFTIDSSIETSTPKYLG